MLVKSVMKLIIMIVIIGCVYVRKVQSLNSARRKRGVQTKFYSGDWLHKRCRCDYISEYYINLNNTTLSGLIFAGINFHVD